MNQATFSKPPSIAAIRSLVAADMEKVDSLIKRRLNSGVFLINDLGCHIINSGGKRLRPILLLLTAKACGYKDGTQHINLAAVVEFIHTATLLHDDVVDMSSLRRGRATANQRWGNKASVLVGDFVYSLAFQMMVECDSMRVMEILSATTNTIAEGEVQQLVNQHDANMTQAACLEIVDKKTAKLFQAAARLGAVLANLSPEEEELIAQYGQNLGVAFQLVDDVLDYRSSSSELGKNTGSDLIAGRPTLPLLYTMWHGETAQSKIIRRMIEGNNIDDISDVLQAVRTSGALEHTMELARKNAEAAMTMLARLPASPYLSALYNLAAFSVHRHF